MRAFSIWSSSGRELDFRHCWEIFAYGEPAVIAHWSLTCQAAVAVAGMA
jgi:hypothetical protein